MIMPFEISVSDDVLEDLNDRLDMARWPDEIGNNWQYGTDLNYLKPVRGEPRGGVPPSGRGLGGWAPRKRPPRGGGGVSGVSTLR